MRFVIRIALLLLLSIGGTMQLQAQGAPSGNKFPVPFGLNNVGKEFYVAFPANWEAGTPGGEKYIRFYITSGVRTRVNVWVGQQFKKTFYTIPYDIVTVDLDNIEGQILVRNDQTDVPDDEVYKKRAVRIEAEAPIVVYGINRLKYSSDGLLALPVNALGQEYIVSSYGSVTDGNVQKLPSQYMIIAPYDGTSVTISHPMSSPNHPAGSTFSISLDKGDVFSSMSIGYGGDLTGSYIYATKPVGVTAGNNCTYIPNEIQYCCCDHITEMLLPISTWGTVYHAMPIKTRAKGPIYRIFAGEPGAKVYINGTLYGTIAGKGGELGYGFFEIRPEEPIPMEFSSDKPIMVAQYNTSQYYEGTNGVPTDPFFLVLTPVEQYQNDLVFTTPKDDFQDNYINLAVDSAGLYQLEIAPGGSDQFELVMSKYAPTVRKYPTQLNGKTYMGATFPIPAGTYRMRGPSPFAGYLYGFSSFDSYGYPLSAALGDLRIKDTVAPDVTLKQNCDGTADGVVNDMPDEEAARANLAFIWLDPDTTETYNYELFVPTTFETGNRSTTFQLRVIDKTKDARAVLISTDRSGNFRRDTVYYTSLNVAIQPNPLSFGNLILGGKSTKTLTITNKNSRPVILREVRLKSGANNFVITKNLSLPATLGAAGSGTESATIDVEFTANRSGSFSDSVGVADDCGLRYIALVTGSSATPIIQVTDIDYGKQLVGTLTRRQFEIRNISTDGGMLTVTGGTVLSAYPGVTPPIFTSEHGNLTFPLNLNAGQIITVSATFQPNAVGPFQDQIVFSHNAPANPNNDSISIHKGEGIQASLFATSYDWPRHRVGTGPYPASVWIKNAGTTQARVTGVQPMAGHSSDFRILNPGQFVNVDMGPGDSLEVKVEFTPTAIGPRTATITYDHNTNQTELVQSVLTGIGTETGLATQDYDFGTRIVKTTDSAMQIKFWMPGDPLYRDTVAITSFRFTSDNDGTTDDFRYTLNTGTTFPIVLRPGSDTLTFTGYFNAQAIGTRRASIRAITADNVDATSNWVGVGQLFTPAISGVTDSVRDLCITDTVGALLSPIITNTGTANLQVVGMRFKSGRNAPFNILDPNPALTFTVLPGENRLIQVRYIPTQAGGIQRDTIVFTTNIPGAPEYELEVSGSAAPIQNLSTTTQITGRGKDNAVELGKEMDVAVLLNEDVTALNAKEYSVVFTYDPKLLQSRPATLAKLEALTPAGSTATVNSASKPGLLIIDVATPTPLAGTGKLLTMPFGVMFTKDPERSMDVKVTLNDVNCAVVKTSAATTGLAPICGLNLRLIELTGSDYALDQNSPNPFNPVTNIRYSLGLDGPTKIVLYDANGRLVQTLVDEYQKPGLYELTVDVTNLPSGNYYYTLTSGTWSKTRMLTVKK